jgi:hypothetical protein
VTTPELVALVPYRPAAASQVLRVSDGSTEASATVSLTVGAAYYMAADEQADDLLEALKDALNATGLRAFDVTLSGQVLTVSADGDFSLLYTSASTTLPAALFGFEALVDTALGSSVTAPAPTQYAFVAGRPVNFDTDDELDQVSALAETESGEARGYALATGHTRRLRWRHLEPARVLSNKTLAGVSYALDAFWAAASDGSLVRIYDDADDRIEYRTYRWRQLGRPWSPMDAPRNTRYEAEFTLRKVADVTVPTDFLYGRDFTWSWDSKDAVASTWPPKDGPITLTTAEAPALNQSTTGLLEAGISTERGNKALKLGTDLGGDPQQFVNHAVTMSGWGTLPGYTLRFLYFRDPTGTEYLFDTNAEPADIDRCRIFDGLTAITNDQLHNGSGVGNGVWDSGDSPTPPGSGWHLLDINVHVTGHPSDGGAYTEFMGNGLRHVDSGDATNLVGAVTHEDVAIGGGAKEQSGDVNTFSERFLFVGVAIGVHRTYAEHIEDATKLGLI